MEMSHSSTNSLPFTTLYFPLSIVAFSTMWLLRLCSPMLSRLNHTLVIHWFSLDFDFSACVLRFSLPVYFHLEFTSQSNH